MPVILQSKTNWKLESEDDSMYDYTTCGNIVRSKATWYKKGEKNNKYFLVLKNLERRKIVYGS